MKSIDNIINDFVEEYNITTRKTEISEEYNLSDILNNLSSKSKTKNLNEFILYLYKDIIEGVYLTRVQLITLILYTKTKYSLELREWFKEQNKIERN